MPIVNKLVSHDEIYEECTTPPTLLNNLDLLNSQQSKEKLSTLIATYYNSDEILSLPKCGCGYKLAHLKGTTCNMCNMEIEELQDNISKIMLWLRMPKGLDSKFINPVVLYMLVSRFKRQGVCPITWLINKDYVPPKGTSKAAMVLKSMGLSRGYRNFVNNFIPYIEIMMNDRSLSTPNSKKNDEELLQLLRDNEKQIFSRHLPIPNRLMLAIEDTPVAFYMDPNIPNALDSIMSVVGIDHADSGLNVKKKEARIAKSLLTLSNYYHNYFKDNASPKQGLIRHNIFGTRAHFTIRAVISSITEPHSYDGIHIPWTLGNAILRPHLLNKLKKRGFTVRKSVNFLNAHCNTYHPLLGELHTEIIQENSEGKGIPCLLQRNPTLLIGSQLKLFISKIKKDTTDLTMGISILICNPLNADFDGEIQNSTYFTNK